MATQFPAIVKVLATNLALVHFGLKLVLDECNTLLSEILSQRDAQLLRLLDDNQTDLILDGADQFLKELQLGEDLLLNREWI